MASQSKTQTANREAPGSIPSHQRPAEGQKRDLPAYMVSHGQGQVRNPQTDRRLRENRTG